jgi:Ras-related protein Rab-6A
MSTVGGPAVGGDSRLPQAAPLTKHKVVFLGDQGTGKTTMIKAFMYGTFEQTYKATVGIDFFSKTLYLDDRTVRLQIWDSAGQE